MLQEEIDFYYNEHGLMVLTEAYLTKRGYCCGNGCKHCPYPEITKRENDSGPENILSDSENPA